MNTAALIPIDVQHLGQTFHFWRQGTNGILLAKDLDAGRWLEFSRPRKIRELIERHKANLGPLYRPDGEEVSPHRGAKPHSPTGGRPEEPYYLTREQVLYLAAKSETPRAVELLKLMITVFAMAMDRKLQPPNTVDVARALTQHFADELKTLRQRIETLEAWRGQPSPEGRPQTPAEALAQRIRAGELGDRFSARDVYIKHWGGLYPATLAKEACRALTEQGVLKFLPNGGRHVKCGRPGDVYVVNHAALAKILPN